MSTFEAVEMEVVINAKIVTYQPKAVVEKQTTIMRTVKEALSDSGKALYFLPGPMTVTVKQGEAE